MHNSASLLDRLNGERQPIRVGDTVRLEVLAGYIKTELPSVRAALLRFDDKGMTAVVEARIVPGKIDMMGNKTPKTWVWTRDGEELRRETAEALKGVELTVEAVAYLEGTHGVWVTWGLGRTVVGVHAREVDAARQAASVGGRHTFEPYGPLRSTL